MQQLQQLQQRWATEKCRFDWGMWIQYTVAGLACTPHSALWERVFRTALAAKTFTEADSKRTSRRCHCSCQKACSRALHYEL